MSLNTGKMSLDTVNTLTDLQYWSLTNELSHKVIYIIGALVVVSFLVLSITKKLKIPGVVGYIFIGILFSPGVINNLPVFSVMQKEWYGYLIDSFNYITVLAVSFISFTIGSELSIRILKKLELEFALIVLFESLGAFSLVTISLLALGKPTSLALILGAIASATAPAATVLVIKEYRAKGELAATLLVVLAIDEALALIIFSFAEPIALINIAPKLELTIFNAFFIPLAKIIGAVILGLNIGYFSQKLMSYYHNKSKKILLLLSSVLGVSALALALHISPLIANLSVGFAYRNFSKKHLGIAEYMDTLTTPLYAIFFILAGTHIRFNSVTSESFLILVAIYATARIIGKVGGASLGAWLSDAPDKVIKYIGVGLLPQVGLAIDLAYTVQREFVHFSVGGYKFGVLVFNVLLFTTAITEIIGPLLTEYALSKTGEMHS
ncbi:Kef-type K+ transport system, membrane component [Halobacteroides halobius DSM 5150]|uniref:Kef-type K+ transport system, membrane component n=1 Tax=Halobacteroides halobius (strain ATCC 35273 / DSM 5150 / MD-1) TaxID=748449 RepID=L0KA50_HALHC|nr:cation:proton antiporter [Halobacteroides halobius]AGB41249.1 Kef-type K+ transport system, membrane component [Halobacteroides halobius DSM 5150]